MFNVIVTGLKDALPFIQRKMDYFLRKLYRFTRAYIDNIVIYLVLIDRYTSYLSYVFQLFIDINLILKLTKYFLGYSSVILLRQRVSSLGIITSKEKVTAITTLDYLRNLKALEYYFSLTRQLRNYIRYYTQLSKPLQKLKTDLLRLSPVKG